MGVSGKTSEAGILTEPTSSLVLSVVSSFTVTDPVGLTYLAIYHSIRLGGSCAPLLLIADHQKIKEGKDGKEEGKQRTGMTRSTFKGALRWLLCFCLLFAYTTVVVMRTLKLKGDFGGDENTQT